MTVLPEKLKIVTIGGGSGQFALLSGLRDIQNIEITAIVSMTDSGGSTGRLRDELGILPPGDLLKCILALSPHQDSAIGIFSKRFETDQRLKGHNAGNMLLTMLSQYTGSFPAGVRALSEILDVSGAILPVTTDQATLVAELTDGARIFGEHAIDSPRDDQRKTINDVFLVPHHRDAIHAYPPVITAIEQADFIIIGPGDLFTSIIPNLIVPGVAQALRTARAKVFYILNIMTKFGETHQFDGSDFVRHIEQRMGRRVDGVVHNIGFPPEKNRMPHTQQKAHYVRVNANDAWWENRRLIAFDLIHASGDVLRHDPKKLTVLFKSLFSGDI